MDECHRAALRGPPAAFGTFLLPWSLREGADDESRWLAHAITGESWPVSDPVALIAHVSPDDYVGQLTAMLGYWSDAAHLARSCVEPDFWPRLARMKPVEAARIMNRRYTSIHGDTTP